MTQAFGNIEWIEIDKNDSSMAYHRNCSYDEYVAYLHESSLANHKMNVMKTALTWNTFDNIFLHCLIWEDCLYAE